MRRDDWDTAREGHRLGECDSDQKGADEPWSLCDSDAVNRVQRGPGTRQRRLDHAADVADVLP